MKRSRRSTQSIESTRPLDASHSQTWTCYTHATTAWDPCLRLALTHPTRSMKSSDRMERGEGGGEEKCLFSATFPPFCCYLSSIHLLWWALKRRYHGNARGCVSIGWVECDENGPRTAPRPSSLPSVRISSLAWFHKSEHQVVEQHSLSIPKQSRTSDTCAYITRREDGEMRWEG